MPNQYLLSYYMLLFEKVASKWATKQIFYFMLIIWTSLVHLCDPRIQLLLEDLKHPAALVADAHAEGIHALFQPIGQCIRTKAQALTAQIFGCFIQRQGFYHIRTPFLFLAE